MDYITKLPRNVFEFNSEITTLDISSLGDVNVYPAPLPNLVSLSVSGTIVAHPDNFLIQWTTLKYLDLSSSEMSSFPSSLILLQQLEVLVVHNNKLTEFKHLPCNLDSLYCGHNMIQVMDNVVTLTRLRKLIANHNCIQEIPVSVSRLRKLEILSLSSNEVEYLPVEIARLSQLRILHLYNNPLPAVPQHLLDGDLHALKAYLSDLGKGTETSCVVQIKILGQAKVVRTSTHTHIHIYSHIQPHI